MWRRERPQYLGDDEIIASFQADPPRALGAGIGAPRILEASRSRHSRLKLLVLPVILILSLTRCASDGPAPAVADHRGGDPGSRTAARP